MGKRRIRCLHELGYHQIIGYDTDSNRRVTARDEYDIETAKEVEELNLESRDGLIISTPPFAHNEYIELAITAGVPAFVEASAIKEGLPELQKRAADAGVRIAPSCTMRFHPAVQDIVSIAQKGQYGNVTSFSYHFGHYLPDWHPWESVEDFYVSREDTAATREMVPFELMWLIDVVGYPIDIDGKFGKSTADVGAEINDVYSLTVEIETGFGTLMVDVVSRYATRRLVLNFEEAQVLWSWDDDVVKLYEAEDDRWIDYWQSNGESQKGYNQNIREDMYIDELAAFIEEIRNEGRFPHTLEEDIRVLELLEEVER